MGFIDWPGGGDFFNVKNDPLASQVILNSDVPLVIGNGEAAKRGLKLTRAEAAALMRSRGPTGEYLYSLFDDWLTREPKLVAQVVAPKLGSSGMRSSWLTRSVSCADTRFHALSCSQTCRSLIRTWLDEVRQQFWRDFTRKIDSCALVATAHESTACGRVACPPGCYAPHHSVGMFEVIDSTSP